MEFDIIYNFGIQYNIIIMLLCCINRGKKMRKNKRKFINCECKLRKILKMKVCIEVSENKLIILREINCSF